MAARIGFIGITSVFSDWSERLVRLCSLHDSGYIATMRRLLAFTMILSLLLVTSMPVQAEVPVCQSAMQQASESVSCDTMAKQQTIHASAAKRHDHERIECGCGCHRDIDGLPHVLDAFSPMQAGLHVSVLSLHAPHALMHPLSLQVCRLQRPPPRTLS